LKTDFTARIESLLAEKPTKSADASAPTKLATAQ
jgi:hypothetical protein